MASKDILPDAQVPISKCEVCDRGVDARFYCQDCAQEMCKNCQKMHLRMKISQNHNVSRIAVDKDTSVDQKESSKLRCQTHPGEAVQMYCLTCTLPVCHTCISDKTHRNHEFDKLATVAEKYKEILSQFITETKQDMIELEAALHSVQNNIQDYTKLADETISDINKQREQIKSETDKVANDLIREVEQCKHRNENTMKAERDKIKNFISNYKELLGSYEEKLKSDIETSVNEFKTALGHKKKKSSLSISQLHPRQFVKHDVKDLENIFGKLEEPKGEAAVVGVASDRKPTTTGTSVNISTDTISSIKPGIDCVSVSAVSDKEAWCGSGYYYGTALVLVETNGTVKKTIKLNKSPYDITVTTTGDVLYTEEGGYTIQKYSLDDKVTVISKTEPYLTQGITITTDGDILVCLYNGNKDNKVVRMLLNGQIKQTIQYNRENKPLFIDPTLVTENINRDICVVDDINYVTVVNKDGQFRFRYPESHKSTNTISKCYGIACDKLGYILISDYWNHQILQIDSDGKFVQFILTTPHGIEYPWGLSIDDKEQLWMCNYDGHEVRVYKYRS